MYYIKKVILTSKVHK